MRLKGLLAGVCAVAAIVAVPANALVINLVDTGGVAPGHAAYTNFRTAANFWESMISTDVTIDLDVGFRSTGFSSANVIAQAGSTRYTGFWVEDFYAALAANANKSTLDQIALANLAPTYATTITAGGTTYNTVAVGAITQQPANATTNTGILQNVKNASGVETISNREWDADGSRNNVDLLLNSSIIKALGYGQFINPTTDAVITFNSAFNFDFDATDGIGVGQTDFLGTAIHEIGHALGFVSGVDIYDTFGRGTGADYDNNAQMSSLDLFRYSDDVTNVAPGAGAVLDWSVGNAANGRPYFSFDGGQSKGLSAYGGNEGFYSTGRNLGDGNQASHWQDTPYTIAPGDQGPNNPRCLRPSVPSRGIMDPTFAPCEQGLITSLDLAAFDAMGWNLNTNVLTNISTIYTSSDIYTALAPVPEPSTWMMLILGFGAIGASLRTRRRATISFA